MMGPKMMIIIKITATYWCHNMKFIYQATLQSLELASGMWIGDMHVFQRGLSDRSFPYVWPTIKIDERSITCLSVRRTINSGTKNEVKFSLESLFILKM